MNIAYSSCSGKKTGNPFFMKLVNAVLLFKKSPSRRIVFTTIKKGKPAQLRSRFPFPRFGLPKTMSRLYEQVDLGIRGLIKPRCRAAELDTVDDVRLLHSHHVHGHLAGDQLYAGLFS